MRRSRQGSAVAVIAVAPTDCTAAGSITVALPSKTGPITFVTGKPDTAAASRPCLPGGMRLIPGNGSLLSRCPTSRRPGRRWRATSSRGTDVSVWRLREGWIPRGAPSDEEAAERLRGRELLFLRNWPLRVRPRDPPGPGNKVAGKAAVLSGTGPRRPGPGHRRFLQEQAHRAGVQQSRARNRQLHHLRLATSSAVHQALASGQPAAATIAALPGELKSILQNGDNPHGPPPKITQVWEETQHDRSETAGPGTAGFAGSGSHAGARCVRQQLNVEHA